MKYKIEVEKQKDKFRPFSVTLTFETREEYVHFHDSVMHNITPTSSHQFHGDIYRTGRGEQDGGEGEI
jgi:hypothetical protein